MRITLRIQRYNPECDEAPREMDYGVQARPTERVLDALLRVQAEQDPSLGFRKSCGHGVCGSDAMVINGRSRLACKTLIRDVAEQPGDVITIEPMRHCTVLRDLIVDQAPFFERYRAVQPYLIRETQAAGGTDGAAGENLQSPQERALLDDPTNCILCGCCLSACPILDEDPHFLGPAAIVQATRFNDDSRDHGFSQRVNILDTPTGVWSCANHFECTRACPREIKITRRINLTKRRIRSYREERGEVTQEEANHP